MLADRSVRCRANPRLVPETFTVGQRLGTEYVRRVVGPRDISGPPSAERLLSEWQRRHRCASASAWVYHMGLDLFSAGEHLGAGRRVSTILGVLAVRDFALFQTVMRSPERSSALTRLAVGIATLSDLLAARGLQKLIPQAVFERERSISQFGLSAGWALQLGCNRSAAGNVASYTTPLLMQLALSSIWHLKGPQKLVYLAREGLWSVIALACVSQLSTTMRQAVDNGLEAAEELKALQAVENDLRARTLARQDTHDSVINRVLVECAGLAETVAQREGVPPTVASLVRAEAERLRNCPEHGTTTVESLALRLLAARPPSAGSARWRTVLTGEPAQRYTLGAEVGAVDWLCDAASTATGDVVLDTELQEGSLHLAMSATSFGADPSPPQPVTLSAANGCEVVKATLHLQAGAP